jgi:putative tricarboxylic transport membrane protein
VRPYQVATAAAIVLIAAVAMFDSRAAFKPSLGTAIGDVGSRWYPFWAATVMGGAALVIAFRAFTTPQAAEGVFAGREGLLGVAKLAIPMLLFAVLIRGVKVADVSLVPAFGFYVATAAYMGFFAAYIGRYRRLWVPVIAIAFPVVIYLMFEIGFRVSLPKSFLYETGFLPF